MTYNIGADIGGTFIKCAVADENGGVVSSLKVPTPDGPAVPEAVCALSLEVVGRAGLDMSKIHSVGIGTTGICDSRHGVVIEGANIKDYKNIRMCEYVGAKLGKEAYLDNDANCAALGEYMAFGAKAQDFIFVTLGTGVGGGVILGGKLLRGINGGAGEIGHITIDKDGELCNCGRRGCWERYASVSALVRQTKAAGFGNGATGRTAFEKAAAGDKKAQSVIDNWLRYVSVGICSLVNIFQPEMIVIGGGVSREGDKILTPIREYVTLNSMTGRIDDLKQTKIVISRLFNDAGVIGASFLYTQKNQ